MMRMHTLCCTCSQTVCKEKHIPPDTSRQQPQHHQPRHVCGIGTELACCRSCWGAPREGRHGHAETTTCALEAHQCACVKNKGWHTWNTLVCGLSAATAAVPGPTQGAHPLRSTQKQQTQALSCKRVREAAACGPALGYTYTAAHAPTAYRRSWGPCHKAGRQPHIITQDRGQNKQMQHGSFEQTVQTRFPDTTLLVCELA